MHPLKKVFYALVVVVTLGIAFSAFGQVGPAPITPQNPCGVPEPNIIKYYTDLKDIPAKRFACAPAPAGTGTGLDYRVRADGVVAWWYCPDATPPTKWSHVMIAGTWERILTGKLTADTSMADPSLTPIWCPYVETLYANYPKIAVAEIWKTSSSVAYKTANKALSGFSHIISKGLVCDCTTKITVGATVYCPFEADTPTLVAQCTKVP